jgi:hypothetical protein
MQAAPGALGLTDLLRFRFGRGVRAGADVRRETHARQGHTGKQGQEKTKEARNFEHLIAFTPRTLTLFDARTVPAGGNFAKYYNFADITRVSPILATEKFRSPETLIPI